MDIFDALIANDRPYKSGIPLEKALEILTGMAEEGKLDKQLVELLIESEIWKHPDRNEVEAEGDALHEGENDQA
jgi:HD-GYP domain-containing protein (c-di-GMP phosphodiesterase class II)